MLLVPYNLPLGMHARQLLFLQWRPQDQTEMSTVDVMLCRAHQDSVSLLMALTFFARLAVC